MNAESEFRQIEDAFKYASPIVLEASASLGPGDTAVLDHESLRNPSVTSMLIDEIRFETLSPNLRHYTSGPGSTPYFNPGGIVRIDFELNRKLLSAVPIPIGMFSPTYSGVSRLNSIVVDGLDGVRSSPEAIGQPSADVLDLFQVGHFRWKLPRPLFVPAGSVLNGAMLRIADGLDASTGVAADSRVGVKVSYVGRSLDRDLKNVREIPIPFVCFFEHTFSASTSIAYSGEKVFYNNFNSPYYTSWLIGRLMRVYKEQPDANNNGLQLVTLDYGVAGQPLAQFPDTRIRTFTSFDLTRGYTDALAIFDQYRRALPLTGVMPPGAGFEVSIDGTNGLPSVDFGFNTAMITMTGWRFEQL